MSKGNGFPPQVRCASNFPPPLVSHTRHNHSRGGIVACHELLLVEILSRLPVKSLMRFKCVCKRWQTLIQNDRHFIDLHYARSQTRNGGSAVTSLLIIPSPMFTFGERVFLLAELQLLLEGGCRATIHGKVPSMLHPYKSILKPVNGLICCVDSNTYSVCIQNPSTRVSTPWIRSIVKQQQEAEAKTIKSINEHGDLVMYAVRYINLLRYTFGYDPATKEHKVISLWVRELANWKLGNREDWLCEVLTVGHHTWRVVEAIPPISPYNLLTHHSVYANGSIYWLHPGSDEYVPNDAGPVIVEFNVGLEKFRVISVPIFIIDDIRAPYAFSTELMEVNGNLVLLAKKIRWPDRLEDTSIKNHDASMKMCTLHVDQDKSEDKSEKVDRSQSSTGTDYFWTGDSFLMPPFDWTPGSLDCGVSIPGTDMFIVKSSDPFSFYFYNWKQKRFSDKLQLHGIRPFIDENVTDQPFDFRLFTFAENIFPVY